MPLKPEWAAAHHKASRFENSRRVQAAATQRKLIEFVIARGGVSAREAYTVDPNAIVHTLYAHLPDGANDLASLFELGRDLAAAAGLTLVALHVDQKREFDKTPGTESEQSELRLWVKLAEAPAYADVPHP